jgi:pimeloyl-ACP methyl ester carboxylesterase
MRVKPAPPVEGAALKTDIPTLILSGELDAYVPTTWARAMLPNMSRSYLIEMRAHGHGPGYSGCGQEIANSFFNDPTRAPRADCAHRARGIDFTR